jgi:hypothetical protein
MFVIGGEIRDGEQEIGGKGKNMDERGKGKEQKKYLIKCKRIKRYETKDTRGVCVLIKKEIPIT